MIRRLAAPLQRIIRDGAVLYGASDPRGREAGRSADGDVQVHCQRVTVHVRRGDKHLAARFQKPFHRTEIGRCGLESDRLHEDGMGLPPVALPLQLGKSLPCDLVAGGHRPAHQRVEHQASEGLTVSVAEGGIPHELRRHFPLHDEDEDKENRNEEQEPFVHAAPPFLISSSRLTSRYTSSSDAG